MVEQEEEIEALRLVAEGKSKEATLIQYKAELSPAPKSTLVFQTSVLLNGFEYDKPTYRSVQSFSISVSIIPLASE
jgi:hypothetical protein